MPHVSNLIERVRSIGSSLINPAGFRRGKLVSTSASGTTETNTSPSEPSSRKQTKEEGETSAAEVKSDASATSNASVG